MTLEELKQALDNFRKEMTDEQICEVLVIMHCDNVLERDELDAALGLLGYEVDEDYLGRKKKTYKLEFRKVAYDRIKEMIIEFKEEKVYNKYEILDMCFMLYKFDYITGNEFKELCESIHFELNEDFLKKSVKDQKEFIDSVYNISSNDFQEKKEFLYDVFGDDLDKLQIVKNNTFVYNNKEDKNGQKYGN